MRRGMRGFVFFLLCLGAAHAQNPPDLAGLSQHKEAWPAQVTLKSPLSLSIVLDGRTVGSTVAAAGTVVELVAVGEKELTVSFHEARGNVAAGETDLAERLAAAATPATPAVAGSPAAPPSAAPAPLPAPVSPAPETATAAATPPSPPPPAAAPAPKEAAPLQFDYEAKPAANYSKAAYRFWCPAYDQPVRAVLVLVPGANGDGRGMAGDGAWQGFARKYGMAIVALFMQGQDGGPAYYDAKQGTGDALFGALREFAKDASRPEIATAPLVLWGHSAGGQFDYDFTLWKPDRVLAFVVNKGGYYVPDAPSSAACAVPGLFFLGDKDEGYRVKAITEIWTVGRKRNALWALAPEPNAHHEVSRTPEVARAFFDGILPRRLPSGPSTPPPLHEDDGWTGDLTTHEIQPAATPARRDASWLPDEGAAAAWKSFVSGK